MSWYQLLYTQVRIHVIFVSLQYWFRLDFTRMSIVMLDIDYIRELFFKNFYSLFFLFFGGFFCFLFFNVTRKKYPKRLRAYAKRWEIIECDSTMTRLPPVWLFFKKSKIGHSCSVWRRVVTGYLKNRFFFQKKESFCAFSSFVC